MTRLSTLQFNLLRIFARGVAMSVDKARLYDQRPFRSLLMRKWISYDRRQGGFAITAAGQDAWHDFWHHTVKRRHPSLKLTSYFDASSYGLTVNPENKSRAA